MGRNLIIKDFDERLGKIINEAIFDGVDISTIVITLDKYLFSARESERQVLFNEKLEKAQNTNKESIDTVEKYSNDTKIDSNDYHNDIDTIITG